MATGDLDDTAFVYLNGSGNGTAKLGPLSAREKWYATNASVKVAVAAPNTDPSNEAQCTIYVGQTATQENFRDKTFSGSSGDASGKVAGKPIVVGNYIWAVWVGGDAGQMATLNVTGTKEI